MRYELFLALRYLRGLRRSQPFVSVIATVSILGVALGVAALLTVLSVMSGFDADLEEKIVGANPHLIVQSSEPIDAMDPLITQLEQVPGVVAAAPYLQTQVLLRQGGKAHGCLLRGVDGARESKVTGLSERMQEDVPDELVAHLLKFIDATS